MKRHVWEREQGGGVTDLRPPSKDIATLVHDPLTLRVEDIPVILAITPHHHDDGQGVGAGHMIDTTPGIVHVHVC